MTPARNTIRTFALVCVAVTSLFIMGMRIWDQLSLSHTDWCSRALGAAKYATGRPAAAIDQCFILQSAQISTLGTLSYIDAGVIALCLFVLMVIVVAGGRVSFKASKTGVEADVGQEPVKAARKVAEAAEDKADEIEAQVTGAVDVPEGGA